MSNAVVNWPIRTFRRLTVAFWPFALGLIGLLSGCYSVDPVVKIGLVGPFEGRYRDVGYDVIYSARLAIRQINEAGGIGKYKIALVALDDFGDPEMAAQSADALVLDPGVVAVLGHWLPETSDVALPIYQSAGLPFLKTGSTPFGTFDPDLLPADFREEYAKVTPFDEVAGPYAGSAYDAMGVLLKAITVVAETDRTVDRAAVGRALQNLTYEGLTGTITQPGA